MVPFDPATVVCSTGSLYLLSKDGGGSAAPLVAARTDRVLRCAVRAAEDRGGRLDPLTILQSYAQGERVRGRAGMRALWGATTVKLLDAGLLDAGLLDAAFVEDVSRLVGRRDVPADSWSSGRGSTSRTGSTRRERS